MNYLVQVDGASEYFIGVLFKTSWALNRLQFLSHKTGVSPWSSPDLWQFSLGYSNMMINLESLLSPVPSIHSGCEFQCRVTVVWSLGMFTQALSRTIPTVLRWWGSPVSGPHCVRALQVGMAPNAPNLYFCKHFFFLKAKGLVLIHWDLRYSYQIFAPRLGCFSKFWNPRPSWFAQSRNRLGSSSRPTSAVRCEADGDAVGAAACSWTPVMLNSTNFCWLNQVEYRSLCCL